MSYIRENIKKYLKNQILKCFRNKKMSAFKTIKIIKCRDELLKELEKLGFNQFKIKGNEIRILTLSESSAQRRSILEQIYKKFGNSNYNFSTSRSSIGHIDIIYPNNKKSFITVKPINKQGNKSAGIDNELNLFDQIKKALEIAKPITVIFESFKNRKKVIKNVTEVILTNKQTKNRAKADIVLKTKKGQDFPISIKKNNAEYWESADSYQHAQKIARKIIKKLENKNQIFLINKNSFYQLIPSIAFPASDKEKKQVVFGSDILLGNGVVIVQDFSDENFEWNYSKKILKIRVSKILQSKKDLTGEDDVWFIVRNDSNRRTRGFYPGLRILACTPKRLTQGVMLVSRQGKILRLVNSEIMTKLIYKSQI
jgi:hypothetical protein